MNSSELLSLGGHPSSTNFFSVISTFLSKTFCSASDPLLDYDLLWNSSSPVFSRCFRSTLPVWTPAVLLWAVAPFEVYRLSREIGTLENHPSLHLTSSIRPNCYNVSRFGFTLLVILVNVAQFCLNFLHWRAGGGDGDDGGDLYAKELTAPLIHAFTFVSDFFNLRKFFSLRFSNFFKFTFRPFSSFLFIFTDKLDFTRQP